MAKITHISVKNYRGLAALEADVAASGAIVKGGNARGKTTILRAIRAALIGQDVNADAIRIGEDRAEILLDIGDVTVKRVITPKNSTVTVERAGMKAKAPQTFLNELVGNSSLNCLDLLFLKAKERRAKVLEALPVTTTLEQLRTFAPDLPDAFDVRGHGLEVLDRARKLFYDERTEANRTVGRAKADLEAAKRVSDEQAALVPAGAALPLAEAHAAEANARREILAIESRASEAIDAERRTASTRARIAELEAEAAKGEMAIAMVDPEEVATTEREIGILDAEITAVEAKLAELTDARAKGQTHLDVLLDRQGINEELRSTVARLRGEAEGLASAIASAVNAPTADEESAAAAKLGEAVAQVDRATLAHKAGAAADLVEQRTIELANAETTAKALDATVKALTEKAPLALLEGAEGIPGLTLDGDDVFLDGKRLDALSGAEQLEFAVEIGRRANAKSKILVVDELERLDPDQFEIFVRLATRDGYQLIGTRVDRGDIQLIAIEPEDTAEAAQ